MSKPTLRIFVLTALLMGASLLSACGGGPAQVSITMNEFGFSPDNMTVLAGAEITLTLRNLGALDHNFHIMEQGEEVADTWTEADEAGAYYTSGVIEGGEVKTVTFIAPSEPGEYQFLCSVPSHFELGMIGTMTVTAP